MINERLHNDQLPLLPQKKGITISAEGITIYAYVEGSRGGCNIPFAGLDPLTTVSSDIKALCIYVI